MLPGFPLFGIALPTFSLCPFVRIENLTSRVGKPNADPSTVRRQKGDDQGVEGVCLWIAYRAWHDSAQHDRCWSFGLVATIGEDATVEDPLVMRDSSSQRSLMPSSSGVAGIFS